MEMTQEEIDAAWEAVPAGVIAAMEYADQHGCRVFPSDIIEPCYIEHGSIGDSFEGICVEIHDASNEVAVVLTLAGFWRVERSKNSWYEWINRIR